MSYLASSVILKHFAASSSILVTLSILREGEREGRREEGREGEREGGREGRERGREGGRGGRKKGVRENSKMYGVLTHCDPNPFTAGRIT